MGFPFPVFRATSVLYLPQLVFLSQGLSDVIFSLESRQLRVQSSGLWYFFFFFISQVLNCNDLGPSFCAWIKRSVHFNEFHLNDSNLQAGFFLDTSK